jgi:hypothetical protein
MRPRTSAAALAAGLTLISAAPAGATTGAAGSGIASAVQYQPETSGSVPVTPPEQTPPPTVSAEASAQPPTTTPLPTAQVATTPVTTTPATQTPPAKTTPAAAPSAAPTNVPVAQTTAAAAPAQSSASSLPFTGYDLVPVALAGLALLALGAVLRHHGRRSRD